MHKAASRVQSNDLATTAISSNCSESTKSRVATAWASFDMKPISNPPKRQRTRTRTRTRDVLLFVRSHLFLWCWWMVLTVHLCDLVFLALMMRLYVWILHDETAIFNFLNNLKFDVSYRVLERMSYVFGLLAVLHGLVVVRTLVQSLRARELVFLKVPQRRQQQRTTSSSQSSNASSSRHLTQPNRLTVWCRRPYGVLMERVVKPLFYINGEYFDDCFLVQEMFEIAAQVYQANRISVFVATRWINNVIVGMIFLNCIATPVIHWLFPKSKPLRRLLEFTMSTFLNFINSVVIPAVVFMKYVLAYDPTHTSLREDHVFDDIWYVRAIRENQQLFVTSYLDFLSTLWPHTTILSCLLVCESMLRREDGTRGGSVVTVMPVHTVGSSSQMLPTSSHGLGGSHPPLQLPDSSFSIKAPRAGVRAVVRWVWYNLLWLSGVVVLGIHMDAQWVREARGCKLHATPWFSGGKSSCVVMNLNCFRLQIEGSTDEIEAVLTQLNPQTMVTLILSHCPELQMPPTIRDFHQLNGIELYNCSLNQWPAESSLRSQDFAILTYVYIIRSNLTSFPEGLMQEDPPTSLTELCLYETNLRQLPDKATSMWFNLAAVAMEYCLFEQVPNLLLQIQPQAISLVGNPIREIQEDLLANEYLSWLWLSGTPLAMLPNATSGRLLYLDKVLLEYTNMESVPLFLQDWYSKNLDKDHSLFGSPFCHADVSGEAQEEEEEAQVYRERVCASDYRSVDGVYPIAFVAPQRLP